MTKRGADVLVETLRAAGVERCYGIVGDTLNQIAHAIDRSAVGSICRAKRPAVSPVILIATQRAAASFAR
jgi:hypothetical protein